MNEPQKKVWFEGSQDIHCSLDDVTTSLEQVECHFLELVKLMPGMSKVELMDKGPDFVTIKTNEGFMKRTHISISVRNEKTVVEFDEEYQAGKAVTANSHFLNEFTAAGDKVFHRIMVSNLRASGFMGFLYKMFGRSNMKKAFLNSYKNYLENIAQST